LKYFLVFHFASVNEKCDIFVEGAHHTLNNFSMELGGAPDKSIHHFFLDFDGGTYFFQFNVRLNPILHNEMDFKPLLGKHVLCGNIDFIGFEPSYGPPRVVRVIKMRLKCSQVMDLSKKCKKLSLKPVFDIRT
jgi:hypothetical protein